MDSRFDEMDKFIKMLGKNKKIDVGEIYSELYSYGLSEEERNSDSLLVNEQQELIKKYSSQGNNVCDKIHGFGIFSDTRIKYAKETKIAPEGIKLYIPTNKENLQEVTSKLLDYLLENSVIYEMKVADNIRADDIVVRIYNKDETARNIIDFINEELKDKLLKTNPFLLKDGAVGIACDGDFSYNESIARFLAEYLKANEDNLENVGLDGFKEYMQGIKDKIGTDKEYMSKMLKSMDRIINNDHVNDLSYLYNSVKIVDLINIALDEQKGLKEFKEHWKKITDKEEIKKEIDRLSDILNEIKPKNKTLRERIDERKKEAERRKPREDKMSFAYWHKKFRKSDKNDFIDFLYDELEKVEKTNDEKLIKFLDKLINKEYGNKESNFRIKEDKYKSNEANEKIMGKEYKIEEVRSELEDEIIGELEEYYRNEEQDISSGNKNPKEVEIREDTRKEIIDKLEKLIKEEKDFELSEEEYNALMKMIIQNPHMKIGSNYKRDYNISIRNNEEESSEDIGEKQEDEYSVHIEDYITIKIGEDKYITVERDRDKGNSFGTLSEYPLMGFRCITEEDAEIENEVAPDDLIKGMENESKKEVIERILKKQEKIKGLQEECERLEQVLNSLGEMK